MYDIEEYKDRAKRAEIELGNAYGKIIFQRIIIIVLAVLLLIIIYFNNYQIVLWLNGLRETVVFTNDAFSNGEQSRFIYSIRWQGHQIRFAHLRRNRFGIWSARNWSSRNTETGMIYSSWTSFTPIDSRGESPFVYHIFYTNDRFFDFIEIDNSLLPQGVIVQVHQFEKGIYLLHFQIRSRNLNNDELNRLHKLINEDFVNYLLGGVY